uniref:Uncharacterized protein n=1 Tax=Oryctolagus cuniculus TaxID=9986 RepID=A0A5F9CG71_RABIT
MGTCLPGLPGQAGSGSAAAPQGARGQGRHGRRGCSLLPGRRLQAPLLSAPSFWGSREGRDTRASWAGSRRVAGAPSSGRELWCRAPAAPHHCAGAENSPRHLRMLSSRGAAWGRLPGLAAFAQSQAVLSDWLVPSTVPNGSEPLRSPYLNSGAIKALPSAAAAIFLWLCSEAEGCHLQDVQRARLDLQDRKTLWRGPREERAGTRTRGLQVPGGSASRLENVPGPGARCRASRRHPRAAPEARSFQQRLSYTTLSDLALALLDGTVFEIVQGLLEIQHLTEKSLYNQRLRLQNEHRGGGAPDPRGTAGDGPEDRAGAGPQGGRPAEHTGEGWRGRLLRDHQPTGQPRGLQPGGFHLGFLPPQARGRGTGEMGLRAREGFLC